MLGIALVIVLLILLLGAFPSWEYNRGWGYAPFSGLVVILVIILVLWLLGII